VAWVDLLGSICALWACLLAVDEHLPFSVVAMGYLIGQFAQVIPVPGGLARSTPASPVRLSFTAATPPSRLPAR